MKRHSLWFLVAAAVTLTGCQAGVPDQDAAVTGVNKFQDTLATTRPADAGVELGATPSAGLPDSVTQAKTMAFSTRSNPFALTAEEYRFDQSQAAERLNSEFGGFGQEYDDTEKETDVEQPRIQPKPAWRLSGIIISEGGVIGLLDQGTEVIQIRPGMSIPNSPYRVVSMDSERAVLRRDDGQLPRDIDIELSGPLGGTSQPATGGAGAPGAGGRPSGSFGPPPGFGGPPGRGGKGGAASAGN
ncbi:MAG: hypothetical protein KF857_07650 [Fimbriimonadaceae bacterium]|nr:hypothetical protein [Fimbriimonadaceae bacterium]